MRSGQSSAQQSLIPFNTSFLALGMMVASIGPAIPDLARQVGQESGEIGWLFAFRNAAALAGALLAGRLFDRLQVRNVLSAALITSVLALTCLAAASQLWQIYVLFVALGLANSTVNVGGNSQTLLARPHDSLAPVARLHFSFGIGAFAAPLLFAVFGDSHLSAPFIAVSIFTLAAATVSYRMAPSRQPRPCSVSEVSRPGGARFGHFLIMGFLYVAVETGFGSWVYSHVEPGSSSGYASIATSIFWGSIAVARLVLVPATKHWRPREVATASTLTAVTLSMAMTVVPLRGLIGMGVILAFGTALALIYPAIMAMANEQFSLTSRQTSQLIVAGNIGGAALPILIGELRPHFAHALLLATPLSLALLTMALLAARRTGQHASHPEGEEFTGPGKR